MIVERNVNFDGETHNYQRHIIKLLSQSKSSLFKIYFFTVCISKYMILIKLNNLKQLNEQDELLVVYF